jgi:hypothetical protein
VYQVPGNRYRVNGEIQYNKFPQEFYGLGNDTSVKNPVTYTPEYVLVEGSLDRSLNRDLKIKSLVFYRNQALVNRGDFDTLHSNSVPWLAGRMDGGIGIGLLWDSRDNMTATLKGSLLQVEHRGSLLRDAGKAYTCLNCEVKVFQTPFPGCTVGSNFLFRDARGDVPLYILPILGGMERLRGYEMGRFVGRSLILVQEDLRFPIFSG